MCGSFTNFWSSILIDEGFINQVPMGNAGWPQPAGDGCTPFASQPFLRRTPPREGRGEMLDFSNPRITDLKGKKMPKRELFSIFERSSMY